MTLEGGALDRAVFESFVLHVRTGLEDLGWVGSPSTGKTQFTFRSKPFRRHEEITPNTIVAAVETTDPYAAEIGSNATINEHSGWIDIYTDTQHQFGQAVATEVAGDVRDMLLGKMSSIGYTEPVFPLFDFTVQPPEQIGWCELEDVHQEKDAVGDPKFHWSAVNVTIVEARP